MALNQTFNQDSAGDIGVAGAVSTSSPSYTTGTTQPVSLTLAGAVRTDSSATTQPVSATSLPLPAGAATSALQTAGNSTLSTISGQLPTTLGQTNMAGSVSVAIASNQSSIPVTGSVSPTASSTATITSIAASTSSVVLLAANSSSKGFIIFNNSASPLYLAFASTASTSAFTTIVRSYSAYNADSVPLYNGAISGIWASASGAALVTAFT